MTGTTLANIAILLAVAVAVMLMFSRLRLPTLVGLFVAGALIGPNGLSLIGETAEVEAVAEVGVIFLLFALGLEFSFAKMLRLGRVLLVAGPTQVVLTGLLAALIAFALGASWAQSIALGMLVSLSSTAVVLKTLAERAEVDTPVGRNVLGILIFQDILVVPMILLIPILAGKAGGTGLSPLLLGAAALGGAIAVILGTKWAIPWLLYEAARTRNADVFLLAVVVLCFAVAAVSARLGLSLALGAFLAGLMISESEYTHQARGYVLPFRNLLVSVFFISVGMLLDLDFLAGHWWMVLIAGAGVMLVKSLAGTAAVALLRYPLRVALGAGLSLSQVGEFSFVLAGVAASHQLLPRDLEQGFLAVTVLSMALTPIAISRAPSIADAVLKLPLPARLISGGLRLETEVPKKTGHLLIIGFGLNGRNLARAAREIDLPYTILEMNPATVKKESAQNEPIYFGDATNEGVLGAAGATQAKVAAVVIGDPAATRNIVAHLRRMNASLRIIARTRFLSEVQPLYALGADEVVPEEFETSIAIFTRTLQHFSLPEKEVERLIDTIRSDHYELLRSAQDTAGEANDRQGQSPNEAATAEAGWKP